MGIEAWSTTPASNNSAPPAGAPEGMAPSAINNVIRQQMADHRAQWNDAEWFNYGDGEGGVTLTYVAADQFKVEGVDVTTAYHVGRRVRVVGTATGTIYGTINAVAFSIDTTVTVPFDSGEMSNETLTVSLGIISAQNEAMKLDAQRLVKGVIEANANFVDFVVFGPALDPVKHWHKRLGSGVATALMLATVEDTGADTEVNVWDLTDAGLISGTPLATVTITGAATPTSIAAAMGYLIVGSEDGVTIIEPHDSAWAERTEGWPKSLSTGTTPALTDNDVIDVCAGFSDQPRFDPRTGGPMPTFGCIYGTGADAASIIKDDGQNIFDFADASPGNKGCAISGGIFFHANSLGNGIIATRPISTIQADNWDGNRFLRSENQPGGFGTRNGVDVRKDYVAAADTDGLTFGLIHKFAGAFAPARETVTAMVNRTFNTGWLPGDIRGAWLANSKTVDRFYLGNTLTENGTVTEAAVASGAELKGYSGFSSSNYFSRASDADWDVVGSGSLYVSAWFKTAATSENEVILSFGNAGNTIRVILKIAGGPVQGVDDGSAANVGIQSAASYDDGVWHKADFVRRSNTDRELYVDGVSVAVSTTDTGSISDSGSLPLGIGILYDGSTNPADTLTLSLVRLGATAPTSTQIRHMYETERRMFEANAKCLLQSGTTDAVLDVSIDPITGKVGVVQTDDEVLFDGLVIDEEPALPAGAANWVHVARYGGDRLVLTNANLYADIAAKDIREELEELRGTVSALPKGPDLGRAKVLANISNPGAPSIAASFNVASVTDVAIGRTTVTFDVPFKSANYIAIATPIGSPTGTVHRDASIEDGTEAVGSLNVLTHQDAGGSMALTDMDFNLVIFGELENE